MTHRQTYRSTPRSLTHRIRAAGLLAALAAICVFLAGQWPASSPSTASSSPVTAPAMGEIAGEHRAPRHEQDASLGAADGAIPDGTTVFDDGVPGVANLAPDLLDALRRAAAEAEYDGVRFVVESGWRSAGYQERLLDDAIAKYGSEAEAARWVATPATSAHVSGDAVDVATGAAEWLAAHGAAFGLCQTYGNEPWHFELRADAAERGCPPMYADPTQDPRTQG